MCGVRPTLLNRPRSKPASEAKKAVLSWKFKRVPSKSYTSSTSSTQQRHESKKVTFSETGLNGHTMPRDICGYTTAVDSKTSTLYLYGGLELPDMAKPVGDLWSLNLERAEWSNITTDFANADQPEIMNSPLPLLRGAFMTCSVLNGQTLLFLTGGYIPDSDNDAAPLSQIRVLAIDAQRKIYWDIKPKNGAVEPRMDAVMAVVDGYIYIFGGTDVIASDDGFEILDSYSIARFVQPSSTNGYWEWVVKDMPYGKGIPSIGYSADICPIYDGVKIALFPGITEDDGLELNITSKKIVFFDTTERTFAVQASTTGTFPTKIFRYAVGMWKRSKSTRDTVLLLTWTTNPPGEAMVEEDCTNELYEYVLPPEPRIKSFNITAAITEHMKTGDFIPDQFFIMDKRLMLLGPKRSQMSKTGRELNT